MIIHFYINRTHLYTYHADDAIFLPPPSSCIDPIPNHTAIAPSISPLPPRSKFDPALFVICCSFGSSTPSPPSHGDIGTVPNTTVALAEAPPL